MKYLLAIVMLATPMVAQAATYQVHLNQWGGVSTTIIDYAKYVSPTGYMVDGYIYNNTLYYSTAEAAIAARNN